MDRLLQYSMERNRAIRMIYQQEDGALKQITCVVRTFDDRQVSVYVLRPPKDLVLPRDSILSADYRKGDEGGE